MYTIGTGANWQYSFWVVAIGNTNIYISGTLIFDLSIDWIIVPVNIYTQIVAALKANHTMNCDKKSNCIIKDSDWSTFPNITVSSLILTPEVYLMNLTNANKVNILLRILPSNNTQVPITESYSKFIIVGIPFFLNKFIRFNFYKDSWGEYGYVQIGDLRASPPLHDIDHYYQAYFGLILGFILVSLVCMSAKKVCKRRDQLEILVEGSEDEEYLGEDDDDDEEDDDHDYIL